MISVNFTTTFIILARPVEDEQKKETSAVMAVPGNNGIVGIRGRVAKKRLFVPFDASQLLAGPVVGGHAGGPDWRLGLSGGLSHKRFLRF